MKAVAGALNRFFRLDEHRTGVRREGVAGVTTFLTMAYIIVVNPAILADAGMDREALITVTVLASVFGTWLIGVLANVPFAMAPGMGLNAFFTYALVIGEGIPWQTALGVVWLAGVAFLLMIWFGVRRRLLLAIPLPLRLAAPAGIGLFISFIGFQNLSRRMWCWRCSAAGRGRSTRRCGVSVSLSLVNLAI